MGVVGCSVGVEVGTSVGVSVEPAPGAIAHGLYVRGYVRPSIRLLLTRPGLVRGISNSFRGHRHALRVCV